MQPPENINRFTRIRRNAINGNFKIVYIILDENGNETPNGKNKIMIELITKVKPFIER